LWQQKINEHYFIKAVSGNKIDGFASLGPDGNVDLLFTKREHQRKGIATKLMVKIENKSREPGITTIKAEVSITALPFFSKNGFEIREKQQKRIKNTVPGNYRMEKILR
jgi:putative acetyltransferase